MEFLRASEALVGSSQPLLLSFLAPTAYRAPARIRIGAVTRHCTPQQWQWQWECQSAHRSFSTSHKQWIPASGAAAQRAESSQRSPTQEKSRESPGDITAIFDKALDGDKGVPTSTTGRTSRFSSPKAQQSARTPFGSGSATNSIEQLLNDIDAPTPKSSTPSSTSNLGIDVDNILASPVSRSDGAPTFIPAEPTNDPAPVKLNSTTGRKIRVGEGMDVARAFRVLGARLAQNNVRKDFQRQRFHERPGLKRKRLKSERWRKRFKEAFQGTVQRVVGLKRQGW